MKNVNHEVSNYAVALTQVCHLIVCLVKGVLFWH